MVGTIQILASAWTAGYGAYPDEPSHFVGGLLIRDYLAHLTGSPLDFAKNHYLHQPYFAIGYWPPLFYLVEGTWMLLFGHTRLSLMVLSGGIAVAAALVLFAFLRKTVGFLWALPTAALFLLIPAVRWSSTVVMTDLAVGLLCFLATLAFGRFFDTPSLRRAVTAGCVAGLAILIKYLAAFVILPPLLLLLIDRRWNLFKRREAWLVLLAFFVTCGPWVWWSSRFSFIGFDGGPRSAIAVRLSAVGRVLYAEFGFVLGILAFLSLLWACARWKTLSPTFRLMALQPLCAALFLVLSPADIEGRYFIPFHAAWLALMALFLRSQSPKAWAPAPFIASVLVFSFTQAGHYAPLPDGRLHRVAMQLMSSGEPASILVPATLEGPMIAELAAILPARPTTVMVRPSKLLARVNWLGTRYQARIRDVAALQSLLESLPINTIVVADSTGPVPPHDILLRAMLRANESTWQFRSNYPGRNAGHDIRVYDRVEPSGLPISILLTTLRDRLPRLQDQPKNP